MQKTRRKRCPECGFLSTQKWGKQSSHQRYKCNNCGVVFTSRRKDVSQQNRFVWFEWWILRKQTIMEISQMSGYSERAIRIWFDNYLKSYPQWEIQRREKVNLHHRLLPGNIPTIFIDGEIHTPYSHESYSVA